MAVTEAEVRALQPGDKIVVISEEEAKAKGYWNNGILFWVGSLSGGLEGMNRYCGDELTVYRVEPPESVRSYTKVFVKENGFWWRDDFIAATICQETMEPLEPEAIEAMLFGGV